eukprot:11711341-Karenia_brevis.AAC.1
MQPLSTHIMSKYGKHANQGGWQAIEITEERINELEPSFEHVQVQPDMNTKELYRSFSFNMHRAKNRKATPPGEVPSELWRLLLFPQWLKPNFHYKRGLGSDQRFPGIPKWHSRMEHLFATINTTKCLPITSVINMGIHVPKKYIATVDEEIFVDTMRSIHVYSAF